LFCPFRPAFDPIRDFKGLFLPFKGSLFENINEAGQKKTDKHHHCYKAIPAQLAKIDSIRIKENDLYIKKDKKNGNKKILDSHGLTGISLNFDPTLKVLELILGLPFGSQEIRPKNNGGYQAYGKDDLQNNRQIIDRTAGPGLKEVKRHMGFHLMVRKNKAACLIYNVDAQINLACMRL